MKLMASLRLISLLTFAVTKTCPGIFSCVNRYEFSIFIANFVIGTFSHYGHIIDLFPMTFLNIYNLFMQTHYILHVCLSLSQVIVKWAGKSFYVHVNCESVALNAFNCRLTNSIWPNNTHLAICP